MVQKGSSGNVFSEKQAMITLQRGAWENRPGFEKNASHAKHARKEPCGTSPAAESDERCQRQPDGNARMIACTCFQKGLVKVDFGKSLRALH